MLLGKGAFAVPLRRSKRHLREAQSTPGAMVEQLEQFGGCTISWMSTWKANSLISLGDAPRSLAGYQAHAGVSIMLGDPVGPPGDRAEALKDFARASETAGFIPCVFSASTHTGDARPEGWRTLTVAEDTIVDLPELAFKGKAWSDVRTAINRAGREDIEFRMVHFHEQPWNILAQARAISEQWTGDKGLPEMRFTLGTVNDALDPHVLTGIAIDAEGSLHGVTSWLPVYGPATDEGEPRIVGWTLDLMRRRDGGFGPVMEFLIASAALHFSEAGYEFLSLSGAPLVQPADVEPGPVEQVLQNIGDLIEPLYGFKSLHRFKRKFNPRYESLYLLYRDEGDLPRSGLRSPARTCQTPHCAISCLQPHHLPGVMHKGEAKCAQRRVQCCQQRGRAPHADAAHFRGGTSALC